MELQKVIETYGIDREDLEGNDWYIVKASDRQVIGDLGVKAERFKYGRQYDNCYKDDYICRDHHFFKPINQKDYIILDAFNIIRLEVLVRIKLQEGYEPLGGVVTTKRSLGGGDYHTMPTQAMYRKGN